MTRSHIIIAGAMGFVLLFGMALVFGGARVEADLTSRGKALLAEQKLDWVEISADGREILLTGTAPSQAAGQQALQLIKELDGVGGVKKKFSYAASNGVSSINTFGSSLRLQ